MQFSKTSHITFRNNLGFISKHLKTHICMTRKWKNEKKKTKETDVTFMRIALTPKGHHQQASNPHLCLHMSTHIQNHWEDLSDGSHSGHLALEAHESCTALNHSHSWTWVKTLLIYLTIVSNVTGVIISSRNFVANLRKHSF